MRTLLTHSTTVENQGITRYDNSSPPSPPPLPLSKLSKFKLGKIIVRSPPPIHTSSWLALEQQIRVYRSWNRYGPSERMKDKPITEYIISGNTTKNLGKSLVQIPSAWLLTFSCWLLLSFESGYFRIYYLSKSDITIFLPFAVKVYFSITVKFRIINKSTDTHDAQILKISPTRFYSLFIVLSVPHIRDELHLHLDTSDA